MAKLSGEDLLAIKKFYYQERLSMRQIADRLSVSIDSVVYFMRRHNLQRRTAAENNKITFEKKIPSFQEKKIISMEQKELKAIGAMLYWGEGYKSEKSGGIDFANSDPEMISMFVGFLRKIYQLDESRFRVLLYCYSDQNLKELIRYWSDLTLIPIDQFTKPYIRNDYQEKGRKMARGLVHIRYSDKKLLWNIKDSIDFYKGKFLKA